MKTKDIGLVGVVGSKVVQLVLGELGMANCWAPSPFVEADGTVPSSPLSCFSANTDPFNPPPPPGSSHSGFSLGALTACDLYTFQAQHFAAGKSKCTCSKILKDSLIKPQHY